MMPEEKAAAARLSQEVARARYENRAMSEVPVDYLGLLLCAVGRIDYMEEKAEALARDTERPLDVRRTAAEILGWKEGEHGGP